MRSTVLSFAVSAAILAATAGAQTPAGAPEATQQGHVIVAPPASIEWAPAPASLPAGAQIAVLEGDPSKPGPFTMRLSMPDGYRIPPHYHHATERVTVVEGTFNVGMGEAFDATKTQRLTSGTYAALGAGMRHFAFATGRTVIQLHGVGPWGLTYVNPADDPRNQK